jgi:lipoate-protein ligase A
MQLLDLTFKTPAENLACDEALLNFFEERGGDGVLRFWEPANYFAVVGYGNHVQTEVDVPACAAEGVPILRRCSGGGTVLQGPGCLNYSLVAKIEDQLSSITSANKFIMERTREAVGNALVGSSRREEAPINEDQISQSLVTSAATIEVRGCTDLTLVTRNSSPVTILKFSGNAQRRKKNYLLFHGTFLLNFDIPLIGKFLRMPSKEPDYRGSRSHKDFLTNLNLPSTAVKKAMQKAWSADATMEVVPDDAIALLARDKYVTTEWNFKF